MLQTHEKFRMMDQAKKNNFWIEVNWNPEDKTTNKSQVLKVTFPNGDTAYILKKHLFEILFAIGTPKQQAKMIPQTIRRSRTYETILGIKAKKDIRKGEMINFPIKLTLPTFEEEVIAELKKEGKVLKTKTGIILP